MAVEFEKMTLVQLKEFAKKEGKTVPTGIKKAELISLLSNSSIMEKQDKKHIEPLQKDEKKPKNEPKDKPTKEQRGKTEEKPKKKSEVNSKSSQNSNKAKKPESTQKPEPTQKPELTQKPESKQKPEPMQKPESKQKPEPVQKPESKQKPEPVQKPEPMQKPESTQKPEPVQKAESMQSVEPTEKLEPTPSVDSSNEKRSERKQDFEHLDSGMVKEGILEVMADGYGFIRCDNYLPGENDVYVAPTQVRKLNLKTGDIIRGNVKIRNQNEKFSALLYVQTVNGYSIAETIKRPRFEDLTPVFPNERIHLETPGCGISMRMVDLISPIGKGQRGMIVSQPKAGKTTLLKQIAKAITKNHPDMHLLVLLIDERPEEVTDMKESIEGEKVEVIYSTFDELPENHKRVSEMVIERAKRLVEQKEDVVILLDSITRLARAYNLTVQSSGRTLSGGLDPAALHMPKRFFGAARNMREGGSLTILATALVETGSRMDDVVFEEFKGTGNMELVLDRNLSEKRIFPALDLPKSSTRRDDLLLSPKEMEANFLMRRALNSARSDDAVERIIGMFSQTRTNDEFIDLIRRNKIII